MTNRIVEDFENEQAAKEVKIRRVFNYVVAVIFIAVGIICIVRYKPDKAMIALGILAIIYGVRKVYKGFKRR